MSEYPASLRQQVRWIKEAIDPATTETQRIELQDIDCDEIEEAAAHIERLEKALAWYQLRVSGCRKVTSEGAEARAALDRDGGEIARQVLGEKP